VARHRAQNDHGFTFLELLIVIGLIAVLSAVLAQRIGLGRAADPRESARALGAELRYTSERAIATEATHRWVVELDEQRFRIERVDEREPEPERELSTTAELLDLRPPQPTFESKPIDSRAGDWHRLEARGILIASVRIGDEEYEKGTAVVAFSSTGASDPAEIELANEDGERVVLQVLPFTSEVRVVEVGRGEGS
jgi:prepilin-type N-terminal cleavage/methylation domain-containing protein